MKMKLGLVFFSTFTPALVSATTVIDTVGPITSAYIDANYARASGTYQWGQTFSTTAVDTQLQSVTVYFNAYSQPASTNISLFKWDIGSGNPESQVLWTSGNSALSVEPSAYFVNSSLRLTPRLNLSASTKYLLVFDQNVAVNGLINLASVYTDGDAFIRPPSSPFSWQYSIVDYADMPVRIELSQSAPVPEARSSILFTAGIITLVTLLSQSKLKRRSGGA
jgi:hypothetical protein